jgi:hypothetical protein
MKKVTYLAIVLFLLLLAGKGVYAQPEAIDSTQIGPKIYVLTKNDGTEFLGEILSQDAREILMRTEKVGDVYIPKHEVKSIKEVNPKYYSEFEKEDLFASRYFITTNGLPIKKGDNYIQWNLYGPDFQFGVADNLGIGVMTSWAAIPILGNIKYSIPLGDHSNMALGMLAGTGSYALPEYGLVLPFASITLGNRRNNLNFSTGYGWIFYEDSEYNEITGTVREFGAREGRFLVSVAGIAKINPKFSLVFDSFISPLGPYRDVQEWNPYTNKYETKNKRSPSFALLLPGLRWQIEANKAFQFGFTGFYYDDGFIPFPIPMVQFYRKL